MAAVRELFALFDVKFKDDELKRGNKSIDRGAKGLGRFDDMAKRATQGVQALGAAVAGVAGIGAMIEMVRVTTESTNELARWGQRLGMTVTDLHGWAQAGSMVGANLDDVTDALKEIQLKGRDALEGTQSYIDAFALIGITVEDLRPIINDNNALMDLFTTRLNENTSAATQNFVADELMSDAGTRMMPLFRQGTREIQRMRREASAMGGRDMPRLAQETARYTVAMRRLTQRWEAGRNALVLRLLPGLTQLINVGTRALTWMRTVSQQSNILAAALTAVGIAGAVAAAATIGAWGPVVATVLGVAVAVTVLALVFDDLLTTAVSNSSDTMTRTFLDAQLGAGATAEAVQTLAEAFGFVTDAVVGLGEVLAPLLRAWDRFAEIAEYIQVLPTGENWWGWDLANAAGLEVNGQPVQEAAAGATENLGGRAADWWVGRAAARRGAAPVALGANGQAASQEEIEAARFESQFLGPRTRTPREMSIPDQPRPLVPGGVTVDSRPTFNINGVTDPEAVGRVVDERLRDHNDRLARRLQGANVPVGAQQ